MSRHTDLRSAEIPSAASFSHILVAGMGEDSFVADKISSTRKSLIFDSIFLTLPFIVFGYLKVLYHTCDEKCIGFHKKIKIFLHNTVFGVIY